jgi:eukaryotic-like serine/threonine-protein kinase
MGAVLEGRYELGREIGNGGHSRVFEALDRKIGRVVAVKVLASYGQAEARQRLEREGRLAAGLQHPNICAITDFGQLENGSPYIVMERLDHGELLTDRLKRQSALPVDVALNLGAQILSGLATAHEQGVVHRDMKPGNVFVIDLGLGASLIKILDFGISRLAGPGEGAASLDGATLTKTGIVIGTAEYMSPEQVRGSRDLDARSDVYSAAVVLYELFAGVRPFHGTLMPQLLELIAYKKAPPLKKVAPHVPLPVARSVDIALSVDRERRPPTAGAFLRALIHSPNSPTPIDEWELPTRQAAGGQGSPLPETAPVAAVGAPIDVTFDDDNDHDS